MFWVQAKRCLHIFRHSVITRGHRNVLLNTPLGDLLWACVMLGSVTLNQERL